MIVEYIRYTIDSNRIESFLNDYASVAETLAASPHALAWELTYAVDDRTQFILRIEWDSSDGHIQGVRKSAEFRNFFSHIRPYGNDIQEMRHHGHTQISSTPATAQ
ncbi:MAG: antibiotic biosynthesis monooxygenase [Thermomicrobiales bacterium]